MRGSRHPVQEQWGDNLYIEHVLEGGDINAAARAAEVTVTRKFRMQRQSGAPLEGRAVLACRDHRLDEVVIYASTQTPHTLRVALAETLGLEERSIRVVAPDPAHRIRHQGHGRRRRRRPARGDRQRRARRPRRDRRAKGS